MSDSPQPRLQAPTDSAATTIGAGRRLPIVMYGIAALLLLGACVVHLVAPDGATVEMPTRKHGREQAEVGLWALYPPAGLALLGAWYATVRLPLKQLGWRRHSWLILLSAGPAVLFAIVAENALS